MTPFKQVAATDKTHALTNSQRSAHTHWLMDRLQFDFMATGDALNGVVAIEALLCVSRTVLVKMTLDFKV